MKRYRSIIGVLGILMGLTMSFSVVRAADDVDIPSISETLDTTRRTANYTDLEGGDPVIAFAGVVGRVIGTFLTILGLIFLALMVYAGWLWLMAGGNDEQVSRAKSLIRQAIIGVIIIIAAYGIAYFVLAALSTYNTNLQTFR